MALSNLPLNFELSVPIYIGEKEITEIQLVQVNGVAETLFMNRLPNKPFTWLAYVISMMVKELKGTLLASTSRAEYLKDKSIRIKPEVSGISIAVASTLILEIHKRTWSTTADNQPCTCLHCRQPFLADIDLEKIVYTEQNLDTIMDTPNFRELPITLKVGYTYASGKVNSKGSNPFEEFEGIRFNNFVFKAPTLNEAIKNEKFIGEEVQFWRKIALDCLIKVTNDDGIELPVRAIRAKGDNFFNEEVASEDLKLIRATLRDVIPTLGFRYEVECPSCYRDTWVGLSGNATFSDL